MKENYVLLRQLFATDSLITNTLDISVKIGTGEVYENPSISIETDKLLIKKGSWKLEIDLNKVIDLDYRNGQMIIKSTDLELKIFFDERC